MNVVDIATARKTASSTDYVTFTVGGQHFGLTAIDVRDVLKTQALTRVPMAQHEIAGLINLRGHIVTAVDLRRRFGLVDRTSEERPMSIVIEHKGEQFCLLADSVGDVLALSSNDVEANPTSMDDSWRSVSKGVVRRDEGLMILLDINTTMTLAA
ncbi:MAG: chemotaxis protein CheW [Rhodospirillaceae bacterium]|nr:chemotaxis protein CheW [Rhodospirillaceae bacterium]